MVQGQVGTLMDGGANGGLINRKDAKVLEWDHVNTVDVIGVTDDSLPSAQAAAKIDITRFTVRSISHSRLPGLNG